MTEKIKAYKQIAELLYFFGFSEVEELEKLDNETLKKYQKEVDKILDLQKESELKKAK